VTTGDAGGAANALPWRAGRTALDPLAFEIGLQRDRSDLVQAKMPARRARSPTVVCPARERRGGPAGPPAPMSTDWGAAYSCRPYRFEKEGQVVAARLRPRSLARAPAWLCDSPFSDTQSQQGAHGRGDQPVAGAPPRIHVTYLGKRPTGVAINWGGKPRDRREARASRSSRSSSLHLGRRAQRGATRVIVVAMTAGPVLRKRRRQFGGHTDFVRAERLRAINRSHGVRRGLQPRRLIGDCRRVRERRSLRPPRRRNPRPWSMRRRRETFHPFPLRGNNDSLPRVLEVQVPPPRSRFCGARTHRWPGRAAGCLPPAQRV